MRALLIGLMLSFAASAATDPAGGVCSSHPCVITVTGSGSPRTVSAAEVQTAIDKSWLGDTIKIEANSPITLTTNGQLHIRKKKEGSGYLTITSTEEDKLPADGTRITPAYLPLTAIIQKDPTAVGSASQFVSGGSWMNIWGGKRYAAEHIKIRGLTFRVTPYAEWVKPSYGRVRIVASYFISTGKDMSSNAYNGTTGPAFYSNGYGETTLRSATLVGDTLIPVNDASWFEPGMTLAILPGNTDWITVASVDYANNNIVSNRAMSFAHTSGAEVSQQTTNPDRDMPDDIVIQHCLFLSDHLVHMYYGVGINTRAFTIRDSFLEGFRATVPTDARAVLGYNGVGPVTLENNYMEATAENVMVGGSTPTGDWELGKAGPVMVRYNYFPKILERDRFGPYDIVVEQKRGQFGVPRLVLAGRYVFPSWQWSGSSTVLGSTKWWVAKNTGIVGVVEPSWPSSPAVGDEIQDGGVTWIFAGTGAGTPPSVKNNFELKAGQNLYAQYNVMDGYPDNSLWNASQFLAVNLKANSLLCNNTTATAWPLCYAARAININFTNNKVITQAGGIQFGGGNGILTAEVRDWTLRNNLVIMTEPAMTNGSPFSPLRIGIAAANDVARNVHILHNTFYAGFTYPYSFVEVTAKSTTGANFPGDNSMVGNIWPRWGAAFRSSVGNDGGSTLNIFPCAGATADNCTAQQWDKNVIVGAPTGTTNFRRGSVLSNCPTSASCPEDWSFAGLQADGNSYGPLLRNPAAGLFGVQNEHGWAKRSMPDGSDIGADTDDIPNIQGLSVTPTDRMVLFQWSVTAPIQNIPCVVEVNETPDFTGRYAGELSDISTYYRQDADDSDRNTRQGLLRMLTVGHSVALTPATLYYYRLQCGGDARHGTFTTSAAMDGFADQTVSRVAEDPATSSMQLVYGPWYNRASGTIGDYQVASAQCESGQTCTVSFPAARGTLVYYLWVDRDSSGAVAAVR